jgi:hypothetical protein
MIASRAATIAAFLVLALPGLAQEPVELQEARAEYGKGAQTESMRSSYVTNLVRMRERMAASHDKAWQAVDAEIMRHPAPPDSATFSRIMLGKWRSPRHDYVYRSDGTWSMLPAEPDATKGTWRFEGNVCVEKNILGTYRYTTLLLTPTDYVCTDGKVVFYRKRLRE